MDAPDEGELAFDYDLPSGRRRGPLMTKVPKGATAAGWVSRHEPSELERRMGIGDRDRGIDPDEIDWTEFDPD